MDITSSSLPPTFVHETFSSRPKSTTERVDNVRPSKSIITRTKKGEGGRGGGEVRAKDHGRLTAHARHERLAVKA